MKKVARALLNRLKQLLVLNWRQKAAARSQTQVGHRGCPGHGAPACLQRPELYRQKCSAVFEHMYESYPERDAGVLRRTNLSRYRFNERWRDQRTCPTSSRWRRPADVILDPYWTLGGGGARSA